jgi:hypothetical protein
MDLGAYVIKGMYVFVMALGAYVRVYVIHMQHFHAKAALGKSLVILELARFVIRTFYEDLVMED